MYKTSKRRREVRYPLHQKLPARILLRNLRTASNRGVDGWVVDASKGGIGLLVQEHVALQSRCTVEVRAGDSVQRFRGEVCYGTRTAEGLKLGILLGDRNPIKILDFLADQGITLST